MEELTFLARKVRADHVLAHALQAMGWTATKLGVLWGCDQAVLDSVILRVEERYPEYKVNAAEFENLYRRPRKPHVSIGPGMGILRILIWRWHLAWRSWRASSRIGGRSVRNR